MKKKIYLLAVVLFTALAAHAQVGVEEQEQVCGTPDMDPVVLEQFEDWLRVTIEEQRIKDAQRGGGVILTIPVVVHVVHDGTPVGVGGNLSVARVQTQIDALNNHYRKVAGTSGGSTHPLAVDSEIEFCLAYLAPDGTVIPERGINRVDATVYGFTSAPYATGYINGTIRPATVWDPEQYMNIWVVNGIGTGNIAGYTNLPVASGGVVIANPPNSPNPLDGFVSTSNNFGVAGGNGESVAVHEIGHWLGLHHIAGPGNAGGSCTADDFCTDTPASSLTNASCSSGSVSSCGAIEIPQLIMYGVVGICRDMFTQCQADRMRAILQNSPQRVELLSSTVCDVPTAPPVAAISIEDTVTCNGTVQFFDNSSPVATGWFWVFSDGQVSTLKNPIVTFATSGTYTATLTANNLNGTSQVSQTFNIVVSGASSTTAGPDIIACEGDVIQIPGTTDQSTATFSWFPTFGISDASIINPVLTATSTTQYYLTAISPNGCVVIDTLNVSVSPVPTTLALPIGGATINPGDSVQLNAFGADLFVWTPATGLSNPNIANPWAKPAVTTAYTVTGTNSAGCAKLDVITVTVPGTTGINPNEFTEAGTIYPAFPNPAARQVTFSADLLESGTLEIQLQDLTGRNMGRLFSEKVPNGTFEFIWNRNPEVPAGTYMVRWTLSGRRFVQKIQLY